jgi:hypothetical protein
MTGIRAGSGKMGAMIRRKGDGDRPVLEPPAPVPATPLPAAARTKRTKVTVFLDDPVYQQLRVHCFHAGSSHQEFMAAAIKAALDALP